MNPGGTQDGRPQGQRSLNTHVYSRAYTHNEVFFEHMLTSKAVAWSRHLLEKLSNAS